ncbi:hypothetical protein DU478_17545 [Thalassococcus profundi]|uniref:Uncharacterized protein n=1 Tax=Thalassococcus profundi TaxID=2282382 RepID=A0A369TPW9_9RHOB|nr:hypothetical protein [Thalassococcus profundi]RDD65006.1 hypothetical protein DU478_17545 [Thalassococcus profundi]
MSSALIALAAEIGAPLVRKVLTRQIGSESAEIVTDVLSAIAERAGIPVRDLDDAARTQPDVVQEAIRQTEENLPERLALYAQALEYQRDQLMSERGDPNWMRAWRPLGMYLVGFLWLWTFVILHVANAIWKIALPPPDLSVLLQLTGLYMALYMGGHTVKDVASKFFSRKGGAA